MLDTAVVSPYLVVSYCLFSMSALSLGSIWSFPFSFKGSILGSIPLASVFTKGLTKDRNLLYLGWFS